MEWRWFGVSRIFGGKLFSKEENSISLFLFFFFFFSSLLFREKGSSPHQLDFAENNALHYACKSGNLEVLELLMKYGTDLNQVNKRQQTPLLVLASSPALQVANLALLLTRGAKLNCQELKSDRQKSENTAVEKIQYSLRLQSLLPLINVSSPLKRKKKKN
jgi:ankyrin repeat protein